LGPASIPISTAYCGDFTEGVLGAFNEVPEQVPSLKLETVKGRAKE